jgi:hypothetical protein
MKNMNEKINKWKPILDCLNMSDTSLYEPLVIFAEEKNKIDFLKTLYTLPISLKILSKLDLTNKKLIVDTENKYQVDDYELSIDVKEVVVGDHLQYQIPGLDAVAYVENLSINELVSKINEMLKDKTEMIINGDFISYIGLDGIFYKIRYRMLVQ